jgi:hypothetical protein
MRFLVVPVSSTIGRLVALTLFHVAGANVILVLFGNVIPIAVRSARKLRLVITDDLERARID